MCYNSAYPVKFLFCLCKNFAHEVIPYWFRLGSAATSSGIGRIVKRQDFERLVVEAMAALPAEFREKLNNVDIVVEDRPNQATMRAAGVRHPAQLLGLYQGIPQTQRTHRYGLVLPDKISLYQIAIERQGQTPQRIRALVYHVLYHEIAHHFGLDDSQLADMHVPKHEWHK
ncbi:MAG TPA: metallopeptidase family protein [Chloroflexi bacterium]|nr:metallopeptidase family protein [Chloroflexota bacterium]